MYLYLNEKSHVDAWVNGGTVPLSLASSYLSDERSGRFTPDENTIYSATHGLDHLKGTGFGVGLGVSNIKFIGCKSNGRAIPDYHISEYRKEDGIILCLSLEFDESIADRMDVKQAAVEITDLEQLITSISGQLNERCHHRKCDYTSGFNRNVFLKSDKDAWQKEYRLYWPKVKGEGGNNCRYVTIPPEIAEPYWFRS